MVLGTAREPLPKAVGSWVSLIGPCATQIASKFCHEIAAVAGGRQEPEDSELLGHSLKTNSPEQ